MQYEHTTLEFLVFDLDNFSDYYFTEMLIC